MNVERARGPRRWAPQTLRRRALAAFLVAGVVAAAGFAFTTATFTALLADREYLIEEIDPAELAGRDLLGALTNQETGLRGFVLTGDQSFLAPYERGRLAQADAEERIAVLGDNRELAVSLRAAQRAAAEWRTVSAEPIIATVKANGVRAASPETLDESRDRFDRFRRTMTDLDNELAVARAAARSSLDASTRRLSMLAVLTVSFVVLVGASVLLGLRRWVLLPLDRLGADSRAVTAGEFRRPITPGGPAELAAVGADIEAMRLRILSELASVQAAQEQLEVQAEELARSNADLEQFAYVASHDLQEPLRKVASFCQLLQRRYQGQLDERADQYIEFAVDGAKRMQALINDLLSFSRVGRTTDEFEPVDCDATLERAMRNLETAIEDSGATIETTPLPTIPGDPSLVAALFQNMIGNALKFRTEEAPVIRVGAEAGESEWCFWVADNGIGIEPAYAERVFVIFQRLHGKEQYPGTGIGLAMCKKIVEFHGGRIWVDTDNHTGRGTTMRWTMPMIPTEVAAEPEGDAGTDHAAANEEISVD